jgi:hypothetical protein
VVVVVLAACGGLQPEDPGQALREGGAAMAKLKTVTATLTFTKGTVTFQTFTLVKATARLRLPTDSDTTFTVRKQDVQFALEVIITGGHVYLRPPFSSFTELTGADAGVIPDLARLFEAQGGLPAIIPAGVKPKYLGAEKVGDVDSHKVDAVLWIGGSDHLIRKAVLSGLFGDNGTASSVEVDLSGFNAGVTISPPPVL